MGKESKLAYYLKYTAGTYMDALASIPIWGAEKICQVSESVLGERNPRFLSRSHIREKSPIYRGRQRLRDSLDTRPGVLFLQNNVIGAIPFILAGIPAAELAQVGIEKYLSDSYEIVKCAANSLSTLTVQMMVGYTTYMTNEVRVNPQKYRDNGKLSLRKIGKGLKDAFMAFLKFDLAYITAKTTGQSAMIYNGKDPGIASGLFDIAAIPVFYGLAIPIGLSQGLIETKETQKWKENTEGEK